MTVSSLTSLGLAPSAALTASLAQAGFAGGQSLSGEPSNDSAQASAPPSLTSLASPSQLFSADSLNALISAQAGQSSDPTTEATRPAHHRHHHAHGADPSSSSTDTEGGSTALPALASQPAAAGAA